MFLSKRKRQLLEPQQLEKRNNLMSEEILIDKNLSDEEIYNSLEKQLAHLISTDEPVISGLSNFTAALKQSFDKISWVGFYIKKNDFLFLGPFQGKTACTIIKIGNGVCGTSAEKKETLIVEDVDKFPAHIACDSGSKSEIVIPIIIENEVWGVLDLDSYEYSSFNEIDKKYLLKLVSLLTNKLDLKSLKIV